MQGRCGGRSGTRSCQVPTGDLLEPGSRHELSRRDTVGRSLDSETAILPRSRGRAFPGMFGIELAVSIMDGADLSEHRRKELALALLMAETIGVILYTGESEVDVRIDAAKDMVREFNHVYEETREL